MVKELQPLDISDAPEILRLAEEVRQSNKPRVLRRDHEDIAILVPVDHVAKNNADDSNDTQDLTARERAMNEWQDVDTDTLIATLYKEKMHGAQVPSTIAALRGAAGSLTRSLSKDDMRDIAREDALIATRKQQS